MATQPSERHIWYSPADCSAMLLGMKHGETYRAPCPACHSTRTDALGIRAGKDKYGNPMTLLYCFAHVCPVEDICAAMGIEVRNLFCIQPDYARETRNAPRARSPRIDRLKSMEEPTPDEIAQILLEEMIVSDPEWIQTCEPAREKMRELAQGSPKARAAFTQALRNAGLNAAVFWDGLLRQHGG
jgi:hypothetical protein